MKHIFIFALLVLLVACKSTNNNDDSNSRPSLSTTDLNALYAYIDTLVDINSYFKKRWLYDVDVVLLANSFDTDTTNPITTCSSIDRTGYIALCDYYLGIQQGTPIQLLRGIDYYQSLGYDLIYSGGTNEPYFTGVALLIKGPYQVDSTLTVVKANRKTSKRSIDDNLLMISETLPSAASIFASSALQKRALPSVISNTKKLDSGYDYLLLIVKGLSTMYIQTCMAEVNGLPASCGYINFVSHQSADGAAPAALVIADALCTGWVLTNVDRTYEVPNLSLLFVRKSNKNNKKIFTKIPVTATLP
eukprot:TRINITY_DN12056_c0_g1_i1.p1 TRINITY_DN12056_c0_g1~~TRINITY_DN12056_c0_g1_i1.p1  ORF type:complete len:304 (+),score=60.51 TRINITY_DN12056_c0_g1_i1:80-991(+)